MTARKTNPLADLESERGFTLIELLITATVLTLVVGATLAILDTSSQKARNDIDRQDAISEAQSGLYRMTRELRQGTAVRGANLPNTGTDSIEMVVKNVRVLYNCAVVSPINSAYHQCVRYASSDVNVPPTTNGQVVIDRVMNGTGFPAPANIPVFTPNSATTPTGYNVTIEVPSKGERFNAANNSFQSKVTLNDGIYLRNATVPPSGSGAYQGGQ